MIQVAIAIAAEIALDAALIYAANKLYERMQRAGDVVQNEAAESIEISDKPSEPGQPAHTRRGKSKRAIRVEVDPDTYVTDVGFAASEMGPLMATHEYGGRHGGRNYARRPVMGPALERSRDELSGGFEDSL